MTHATVPGSHSHGSDQLRLRANSRWGIVKRIPLWQLFVLSDLSFYSSTEIIRVCGENTKLPVLSTPTLRRARRISRCKGDEPSHCCMYLCLTLNVLVLYIFLCFYIFILQLAKQFKECVLSIRRRLVPPHHERSCVISSPTSCCMSQYA